MNLFKQVSTLVRKDMMLEWRSKYAINGILLYVVSTVFVCYQSFRSIDPVTWNALFWIIILFAAINAISRSFIQEQSARQLYYYSIVSAKAIILSKIIYNSLVMLLLAVIAFVVYNIVFNKPIGDPLLYFVSVLLGSISFASVFTMVSGISAKAGSNSALMAILSFPVVIPLLIVLINLSKNAMEGLSLVESMRDIIVLLSINIITVAISLILFPYLWKD